MSEGGVRRALRGLLGWLGFRLPGGKVLAACSRKESGRRVACGAGECGEASVEFIGVVVVFLVPLFYFLWSVGMVQSTSYAAESAARNAARIVSVHPDHVGAARVQADLAFADYGLDSDRQVDIVCFPASCLPGSGQVSVTVSASVPLPLIPSWVTSYSGISVRSQVTMPIEGVQLR